MQQLAEQIAEKLEQLHVAIDEAEGDEVDQEVRDALAVSICRMAKLLIPDVQRKIDEIVYAYDHNLEVSSEQHGHDLHDADGNRFELKVSVCKKPTYSCNINFPVPKGEDRRDKLLASVRDKMEGGGAIFVVRDGKQKELRKFEFTEAFMLGYFTRLELGKAAVHNLGCKQCRDCKKFHRLEKFQLYSDKLEEDGELSDDDWTAVFEKTAIRCHA